MTDEELANGGLEGQGSEKATPSAEGRTRERSKIGFPYIDLAEAVFMAKGVHDIGGSACDWDQLAAHLKLTASGGGFRQRMMGARVFGLVEYVQKRVTLMPLGTKICDPKQEASAKSQAFLSVPLYLAIHSKFKGGTLPPNLGLEAEMTALGVPQKQAARARQVFHRSADQAGFFWSGSDRLVAPVAKSGEDPTEHEEDGRNSDGGGTEANTGDEKTLHPLIEGLIQTLPKTDGSWPIRKRIQWLQAAVSNFNLIYADDDSGNGSIEVRLLKESK